MIIDDRVRNGLLAVSMNSAMLGGSKGGHMKRTFMAVILGLFFFATGCGGGASPAGDALTTIVPADGATGIPVTQIITATFNASLNEATLTSANITLTHSGGINVPGAIAYDDATKTLTFAPQYPLSGGMLYTFTLGAGATTKAAGDRAISFTTVNTPILYMYTAGAATSPNDLWSMNADGSGQINLTNFGTKAAGSVDFIASWSPDLTRIAFVAEINDPDDRQDLFVMNADGSNRLNITNGGANSYADNLQWAPDGSKIYYIYTPDDVHHDIWAVNADGTGATNITNLPAAVSVEGMIINISLDGTRIYYCAGGAGATDPLDIYSIGTDGTGNTNITNFPASYGAAYPRLSPDGTKLYYMGKTAASEFGIYSINVDGTGVQTLVAPVASRPAIPWEISPDGSRIVVSLGTGSPLGDVVIVNTDGSGTTTLAAASGNMAGIGGAWSPDGTKVAYAYGDTTIDMMDLFVANRDGTGIVNLTNNPAGTMVMFELAVLDPSLGSRWSPDGTQLVYTQNVDDGVNDLFNVISSPSDGTAPTALTSVPLPQGAIFLYWW